MIKRIAENGVVTYTFEQFDKIPWLGHGLTTRMGGVSAPPFHSFNLGKNTLDVKEALEENYRRLIEAHSTEDYRIFLTNQVHGDTIQCVAFNNSDEKLKVFDETDGLMSDASKVFLMSFYADCTPLFFVDPVKKIIAVSHAGWKGTVKNIGKKTVEQMCDRYGSRPEDILAGIGASAGICCYEVGGEVIEQLTKAIPTAKDFYIALENGKYRVDVKKANVASIMSAGVLEEHIEVSDLCTICNEEFFSYRRDGITGRMSGFIYLK
ncbi:MAG: peptidoglycan editing factor PgeF [Clostridia bacterium]|nr:peptidoglycan editing factor PgeF [Clostridia bacterium]